MHCAKAIVTGFLVWFFVIGYTFSYGGDILAGFIAAPMIISGFTAVTLTIDLLVSWAVSVITKKFLRNAYELESTAGKGNKIR